MRVLVTGAAGFIGGHLARTLAADGHTVVAVDREVLASATSAFDSVVPVQGDIRDQELMASALKDVEVVYHQAAVASVPASFADPAHCVSVNVEGSATIFEQARLAGVRRVVVASTSAVYGDDPTPVKHERLTPAPRSPYAVSKLAMEMLADVYFRQFGLETVALRYFNVYGPGQPAEGGYAAVIPAIREAIVMGIPFDLYGDGEQTRSFVFVGDVVRANRLAAVAELTPSDGVLITNVTGTSALSLNDLLSMFATLTGERVNLRTWPEREGDIKHSAGDGSVASERLGFEPEIELEEGLRALLGQA